MDQKIAKILRELNKIKEAADNKLYNNRDRPMSEASIEALSSASVAEHMINFINKL